MKRYHFPGLVGQIQRYDAFPSRFVRPRKIDVWLPPGYDPVGSERYAVLYMLDGQNLFNPKLSRYSHVDWGTDETLNRLVLKGKARPTIVVGIWSNRYRSLELMPKKALINLKQSTRAHWLKPEYNLSDLFMQFLTGELKPMLDSTYNTFHNVKNTFIMGSSLGAITSLQAVCESPQVFGGAGCVSMPFLVGEGIMLSYLKTYLPVPGNHKFYFDFGTIGHDEGYEQFQKNADEIMLAKGYRPGVDWITQKFKGHDHSEVYWRERVHFPLEFLLGN
jgi:predicted alpha/beta superfamily hydrolase